MKKIDANNNFTSKDMINFAEYCRNGLLNTEYDFKKRKKLLKYWMEHYRNL